MSEEKSENGGLLDLGSINFTPDWAKKSAGVSIGKVSRGDGSDRDGRGPRHEGGRKPFGDRKGPQGGPHGRKPFGDRRRQDAPREQVRPLDVDVKILPEPKALGAIMRKLQQDIHAYKLKDLAYFFLDNPSSVLLKISPRRGDGADAQALPAFRQCRACGFAALSEADLVEHVLSAHLGDYYEARDVECEPPSGNFSCVAKCGLSGELLGPPNIHEFNSVVREMIRTRYPGMSEEQYRSHIEMVRDADTIEAWRKGKTTCKKFFPKGDATEGAQGLTREQAEGEFKRTILGSLVDSPKGLSMTADIALKSPVKPLQWAVRNALDAEMRAPFNMCFALRGAFHHRKFKFFRANDQRGPEFVSNVEYKEFDAAHAIPELAAAAKFLEEHPCCDKGEFPKDGEFEKHMNWLVTTGHAVAFTNGVFSKAEKFPKYGPQWKKRRPAANVPAEAAGEVSATAAVAAEEAPAPAALVEETPAPAAVAVEEAPAPVAVAVEEAPAPVDNTIEEKKDEAAPVLAE